MMFHILSEKPMIHFLKGGDTKFHLFFFNGPLFISNFDSPKFFQENTLSQKFRLDIFQKMWKTITLTWLDLIWPMMISKNFVEDHEKFRILIVF